MRKRNQTGRKLTLKRKKNKIAIYIIDISGKSKFMEYIYELQTLKRRSEKLKTLFYNEKGKQEQLLEQKIQTENHLNRAMDSIDILEKVRILLQKASEYARESSKTQIESLVTKCLQFIFDSNIEFKIEISELRGKPEAEFYVISNVNGDNIKTKPQDARCGGIVDIISLALRIAMLQCGALDLKGPILLDEPAKHVSDEYITNVAEFLKQVCTVFQRQVIMVTHNKHLSEIADKWYRVEMKDGNSKVSIDS
jgi:DNA repair exonuclease SbcCD ATPase subunit